MCCSMCLGEDEEVSVVVAGVVGGRVLRLGDPVWVGRKTKAVPARAYALLLSVESGVGPVDSSSVEGGVGPRVGADVEIVVDTGYGGQVDVSVS